MPLGYLPSYLQDNFGLVVTPDGGELVSLPLAAPATNRLLRMATLSLGSTGNLSGEVKELRFGGPAETSREQFLHAGASRPPKGGREIPWKFVVEFFAEQRVGG